MSLFVLCSIHPKLTSLGLGWTEAQDLPVGHRDQLLQTLDDVRDKEIKAYRRR